MIFSFLLMYGRTAALIIVVLVLAVSNFILAFFLLRTKLYKNVFTAFSGNGILKNSNSNLYFTSHRDAWLHLLLQR